MTPARTISDAKLLARSRTLDARRARRDAEAIEDAAERAVIVAELARRHSYQWVADELGVTKRMAAKLAARATT